jgi:hypothetical protein
VDGFRSIEHTLSELAEAEGIGRRSSATIAPHDRSYLRNYPAHERGAMRRRVLSYLQRHHWGLIATFIALGGTAYATSQLPPNSVGTLQIQRGAVTLAKLHAHAVSTLRHPIGRAGGGLAGEYPNPRIAPAPRPSAAVYGFTNGGSVCCGTGWQDYGSPYPGASYYRDSSGVVHLDGVVSSYAYHGPERSAVNLCRSDIPSPTTPTPTPILTLPTRDRPAHPEIFAVLSGVALGRVDVLADGAVMCVAGAGDQYVSLDGIAFRTSG